MRPAGTSDPLSSFIPSRNRLGVEFSFLEELSSLFGKGRVDVDAGPHFKSGRGSQPGDDLKVPMVVVLLFVLNRHGIDDVIVSGIVQLGIKLE